MHTFTCHVKKILKAQLLEASKVRKKLSYCKKKLVKVRSKYLEVIYIVVKALILPNKEYYVLKAYFCCKILGVTVVSVRK